MKKILALFTLENLLQKQIDGVIVVPHGTYKSIIGAIGKFKVDQWAIDNNVKVSVRG